MANVVTSVLKSFCYASIFIARVLIHLIQPSTVLSIKVNPSRVILMLLIGASWILWLLMGWKSLSTSHCTIKVAPPGFECTVYRMVLNLANLQPLTCKSGVPSCSENTSFLMGSSLPTLKTRHFPSSLPLQMKSLPMQKSTLLTTAVCPLYVLLFVIWLSLYLQIFTTSLSPTVAIAEFS